MTPDHSALIERLEAAHATGIIMESEAIALQSALGLEDAYDTDWKQCCWNALKGSLDAALALAEEALEMRGPININVCLAGSAQAQIYPDDPCGIHAQAVASTPALALCIAILRAKQGEGA